MAKEENRKKREGKGTYREPDEDEEGEGEEEEELVERKTQGGIEEFEGEKGKERGNGRGSERVGPFV